MPIAAEQLHGMHLPQAIHLFVPLEEGMDGRLTQRVKHEGGTHGDHPR